MSFIEIDPDTRQRTYLGQIEPGESWCVFEGLAEHLGAARRADWVWSDDWREANGGAVDDDGKKLRLSVAMRQANLSGYRLSDAWSKSVIIANDNQRALMWRVHRAARRGWHQDVAYAKKNPNDVRAQHRSEVAQSRLDATAGGPTITFGGNKLWREAQTDPAKMSEFKLRRWYCSSVGDSGRKGGNRLIRVDDDGNLWINDPRSTGKNSHGTWVNIGRVRFPHGDAIMREAIQDGRAIAYSIQRVHGRWALRAVTTLPSVKKKTGPRLLGVDVNSGHIDGTILDEFGNPIAHLTVAVKKRGARAAVETLLAWAARNGVTAIGIEELTDLQRNRTRGGGGARNRAVSSIPTGQIKRAIAEAAEDRGWLLVEVYAAGTSANTKDWVDVCRKARSTHQQASYLIGRRALGYTIDRGEVRARKQERDSGRSSAGSHHQAGNEPSAGEQRYSGDPGNGDSPDEAPT